jgi:RNA polymerase sigma-70 factor (ECF subfamily)
MDAVMTASEAPKDERALVARMLAGDEQAMEMFGDHYFPGLYRFAVARLRGDRELARDMVQTTVVKALSKLRSYRGEAPLAAWLRVCCRNEIGMHFRHANRYPVLNEDDEHRPPLAAMPNPDHVDPPERAFLRKEESGLVHEALDLLPWHYAKALEWKYLKRLSVQQIASRLEQSPKAAESVLTRAREAFRQVYRDLIAARGSPAASVLSIGEVVR